MASYMWDYGFDFNAIEQNGTSFLQSGFVRMDAGVSGIPSNVPGTPVDLKEGDLIGFNAFNVTANPTGIYAILSGTIQFQSAVQGQTNSSPFSNSSIPFGAVPAPTGNGPSVICSGIQAISAPQGTPTSFPAYAGPQNQEVQNDGRFLIKTSLIIQQTLSGVAQTPRTFSDDPEMVVGGAG